MLVIEVHIYRKWQHIYSSRFFYLSSELNSVFLEHVPCYLIYCIQYVTWKQCVIFYLSRDAVTQVLNVCDLKKRLT